jgi:signal transduction histidine kinase/ActR/RegA family two-component response regulator
VGAGDVAKFADRSGQLTVGNEEKGIMNRERQALRRMMRWPVLMAVWALCLCGHAEGEDAVRKIAALNLSPREIDWLARHPVVNVAFDPAWTPIEYFDAKGEPSGISAEYLRHLERILKVQFKPLQNLSWSQAVDGLKDGTIEMASAVQETEQRRSFLQFTAPYMSLPIAIFTKNAVAYADLSMLRGKPVAVIQGFAVHDFFALHHPEIPIVQVKSIQDGLDLVRRGNVFAFIEVFAIGSHGINDLGFFDLHAAGAIDFRYAVAMGASVKHPELASILQKVLAAVPETERARYYQRWFAVPFVYKTDYSVVWWVVAGALSMLLLVLYWNHRLEQRVVQRTAELALANTHLKTELTERQRVERELLDVNERLEGRVAERTAELKKAYDALELRAQKFRALAAELVQTENRERHRIAQLLHDNPQQLLAAAKFNMASLITHLQDPGVKGSAEQLMTILDQSIDALRSLTLEISPPILHDVDFMAGLNWLARWMAAKYKLTVHVSDTVLQAPLSDDLRILLFLSVRELLFNVVKHSGIQEARVVVGPWSDGLRISVEDKGKGFDATRELAEMPMTFGLFNMKERLGLINGRLDIISTPGQGTKAVIEVPLPALPIFRAAVSSGPRGETTGVVPVAASDRGRIRILVVDDHAVVRQGMVELLSREPDLDIIGQAVDGLDAIEKALTLRPDVILMDVSMPRLNGLKATQRITAAMPEINIIGLSLHESEVMMSRMQAVGAKRFLEKTSPIDEIIAAIRAVAHANGRA